MIRFFGLALLCLLSVCIHFVDAMELARSADEFVESIGVCTHWTYSDTPYGKEYEKGKQLLKQLGVRYIRDRTGPRLGEIYKELGVKANVIVWPPMEKHLDMLCLFPDAIESIEGPNETNGRPIRYKGIRKFPEATKLFQNDLYAIVKSDPKLKHIPVIAPSTAWFGGTLPLAPLLSYDLAVSHSYPGGRIPSYLTREKDDAYKLVGTGNIVKPIVATESGYHLAYGIPEEGHQGVTSKARTKYIPRLLAEYFNQGIIRTYLYEFICTHEHMNRRGLRSESKYGLVRYDMTPTPSFYAVKNLIHILKEPGITFKPQALDLKIQSDSKSLHHTLLQKSDGTYYLLLWDDHSVYQRDKNKPDYGKDIDNLPMSAVITLRDQPVQAMAVYVPAQSDQPVTTLEAQQSFQMMVRDEVHIVTFKLPAKQEQNVAAPEHITVKAEVFDVVLAWQPPLNNKDIKGYFVYRVNECLGFTDQTYWQDTVTLPGMGYTYGIQSVDRSGNMSTIVEKVVMTKALLPDMVVSDVSWEPANPKVGDKVSFKATIKNIGKFASPAMTHGVAFRVNGKIVSWFDRRKQPIASGESLHIIANSGPKGNKIWFAKPGEFKITAHVDDQDRFREENELNNKRTQTLTVKVSSENK